MRETVGRKVQVAKEVNGVGVPAMPESSTSLVTTRDGSADELAVVLHQAARATFGATALITDVVLRTLSESAPARSGDRREASLAASEAVDVALGLGWGLAHVADRLVGLANKVASPALSLVLAPPLVPEKLHAARLLRRVSLGWRAERPDAVRSLYAWSASAAPAASDLALSLVDVDELVSSAVARLDLTRLVEQVLAGLDLTPVVENVVQRMDLEEIVGTALDQLDLTQLVLERVDLVRVVDVIMDEIDLPEIIRGSTGSMALETMQDVRLQGIEADRAVSRLMDRVLRRRADQP
jgi:hypothetical protein